MLNKLKAAAVGVGRILMGWLLLFYIIARSPWFWLVIITLVLLRI
ncbi:hypothetical protein [Billgrantia desiderata]|nr:hypothetical protein [Halomonas desiderata]